MGKEIKVPATAYSPGKPAPSSPADRPYVATVGTFDGVHLGHRHLISQVLAEAASHQLQSMVITFDRHPSALFGTPKPSLTTIGDKRRLLADTGVDRVEVLTFDTRLASLSAADFMQLLRERYRVGRLVVGFNNRFGRRTGRQEGFADYVAYGRAVGIEVVAATEYPADGSAPAPSSTAIRQDLMQGDVETAARRLGRPYTLTGTVVHGRHVGTRLGFPTANLQVAPECLIPKPGVYAVEGGMLNIGTRPTFGGRQQTLEVNLFADTGNLYGRQLTIAFWRRLRDERTFATPEELIAQLRKDREECLALQT